MIFFFFFTCIRMSENWSDKYYQDNKERLQKKLVKDTKVFLKRKKKKCDNIDVNYTKISQKMKNKSWLSIEKNIINEKTFYFNYRKLLSLRKIVFFLRVSMFFLFLFLIKKLFLLGRKSFFISRLGLKISVGRLNQHSFHVKRNSFTDDDDDDDELFLWYGWPTKGV